MDNEGLQYLLIVSKKYNTDKIYLILISSLEKIHSKFSNLTPCVIILNNGLDPVKDLINLAKKNDITGPTFKVLSLGTCEETVSFIFLYLYLLILSQKY